MVLFDFARVHISFLFENNFNPQIHNNGCLLEGPQISNNDNAFSIQIANQVILTVIR